MPQTYSRFAVAPIGPSLVAGDDGLTLTTLVDGLSLSRQARSDVTHTAGSRGAEFSFWGDATLQAAIGVTRPAAALAAMVGADAQSVGWRLDTGNVYIGNAVVASGLPSVAKQDIVGLRVALDGGGPTIVFYKNGAVVHTRALPVVGGTWHFAVSLAAAVAGTLVCAVNSGQWQGRGNAILQGGWEVPAIAPAGIRLADLDYLTATGDNPANTRYEGLIDAGGITTLAAISFWPWGGDAQVGGATAQLRVLDAAGLLDALAVQDVSGLAVAVSLVDVNATLASATPVARFLCEDIEAEGDGAKLLTLRNPHEDLDESIARGQYLPNIPALAWRTQPVVIGAVASVPALMANSDGSVSFLADAPLASVMAVMDRGDNMEVGTYALDPSGQQLLLDSPPVGPVVVDASSIGSNTPATLEQALTEIFRRIGKSAWSSDDAAAIDTATGYAGIGYYAGDQVSARLALASILPSYGAWWYEDVDGVLRFVRVIKPESVLDANLAFELQPEDLEGDLVCTPDMAPNLSRRMAYQPNAAVLGAGDLVTDLVDVPQARRIALTSPWRGLAYSGVTMSPYYAHAGTAAPIVSCFWRAQDAQAEINRVCGLYTVRRFLYLWRMRDFALAPKPGQVGRITHPRYGLQAGRKVLVREVTRNPVTGEISMLLWGA